jgi:hypothetical protein
MDRYGQVDLNSNPGKHQCLEITLEGSYCCHSMIAVVENEFYYMKQWFIICEIHNVANSSEIFQKLQTLQDN